MALGLFAICAKAQEAKVTPLLSKDLAGLAGKEAGEMVTVEYAPGASSKVHRHNAHTFVYVLEGSVVMQVKGGQPVTLGPKTFYESPADIHTVSKNASNSLPAKFLVFFVKDEEDAANRSSELAAAFYVHDRGIPNRSESEID